jgi:hypothetical protein
MFHSILGDLNMLKFHVSRASRFDISRFESDAFSYLEKIQSNYTPGPAVNDALSNTRSCIAVLVTKLRRERELGGPYRLEVLEARTTALAQINRIATLLESSEISSPTRTFGH